jgi:Tfp pilus assembly protein PilF
MRPSKSDVRFSKRRSCSIVLLGAVILAILAWQASKPIKEAVAERYLARGDVFMTQRKFDEAQAEYEKAIRSNTTLVKAHERQEIAAEAATDIAKARAVFSELNQTSMVEKIDQATATFTKPKEALKTGMDFYTAGEYALARYPLEQAVQLDPAYPEAWHYIALTYDQLAASNASFREKAQAAREKRDALSPQWLNQ